MGTSVYNGYIMDKCCVTGMAMGICAYNGCMTTSLYKCCVTGRTMDTSCVSCVTGGLWVYQRIMGTSLYRCVTGRAMGISAYNGYITV